MPRAVEAAISRCEGVDAHFFRVAAGHASIDRGGADGYVTKTTLPTDLIASILAVARRILRAATESPAELQEYSDAPQLTPRELEVLQLLRKGMSNPDIGLILGITPRTAKAHVAAILVKLEPRTVPKRSPEGSNEACSGPENVF